MGGLESSYPLLRRCSANNFTDKPNQPLASTLRNIYRRLTPTDSEIISLFGYDLTVSTKHLDTFIRFSVAIAVAPIEQVVGFIGVFNTW